MAQNFPILFLCCVTIMTPVKSQLCLVNFAAEVKKGFGGDIAALYFTLSKSYGCIPCSGNGTVRELPASEIHCSFLSTANLPFPFLHTIS